MNSPNNNYQNDYPYNSNLDKNYESQINILKRQLNEEKNKNQLLMNELINLKNINNNSNLIIKSLKEEINQKNKEIQNYKSNSQIGYSITSKNNTEQIWTINFNSVGEEDIGRYSLACKKTDLFIKLEERIYADFPQFKNYDIYFELNKKRIKRYKTLEENHIENNSVVDIYLIDN
jgi:hypothetical protein